MLDAEEVRNGAANSEDDRLAEERFARHFGAVNSGDPNSADNEKIDADLAKAYEDTHDDQ